MITTKPNIVFLFTDDQRFDTIAALGNEQIRTPHLDGLVVRGTAFTQACIPGGTSPAVCMPSRAMLHTGRSLFHLTDGGQRIDADHTTIGEALQGAGYRTYGSGKWHNGCDAYARSFTDGDEIMFGGMADHWNVPAYHFDPAGRYDALLPVIRNPGSSRNVSQRRCDHIHAGCHSTDTIADRAIEFIGANAFAEPLFMYISFLAPHDPRSMPQRYLEMYDIDAIDLPESFCGGHPFDNGELQIRDELLAAFPRNPDEIRRHILEYYAMISHLDDRIGDIIAAVESAGQLDNTIFVVAGDNGLAVGQHGLMGKQNLYEHSIRVPLIFAGPGVPEDTRSQAKAYLLDLFPTFCELAGTAIPESVEGRSLLPCLQDPQTPLRKATLHAYCSCQRAVRTENHKLIEYVVGGRHSATQLFDIVADPDELHDLSSDADHADVIIELRGQLRDLAGAWDDRESTWGQVFWDGYEA